MMKRMPDLKHCPFCGGEATRVEPGNHEKALIDALQEVLDLGGWVGDSPEMDAARKRGYELLAQIEEEEE